MTCSLCGYQAGADMMNHVRLMHPDILSIEGDAYRARMSLLRPVTLRMSSEDWVCENCDRQFVMGMLFGEIFEAMFGDMPIMSTVCGECFMSDNEA
jgi:hypothetical protein